MKKTVFTRLLFAAVFCWLMLTGMSCPPGRGELMNFSPHVVEFPPTPAGFISDQQTFTLTNITGDRFHLEQIVSPNLPFRLVKSVDLPKYVAPGQVLEFKVEFRPTEVGDFQSSIRFIPDFGFDGYIQLKGKGITPGNEPPGVDLGADLDIALSDTILLEPDVTHDGVPGGEETLTYLWEKTDGPGEALFTAPDEKNTELRCTREGVVTIRFSVNDGELTGSDELLINVGPSTDNLPPEVEATGPESIYLPDHAQLSGEFFDDGLPDTPGWLSFSWRLFSGPGEVIFSEPQNLNTVAWFDTAGDYFLELTADDGELQTTDLVHVLVKDEPWNTFNLEGGVEDGLLKLTLGTQRLDWDYNAFKTHIYIPDCRLYFLHASLLPEAGLDPDLIQIYWVSDFTLLLTYSGDISADQPRPLVDIFFERRTGYPNITAPSIGSAKFLDGETWRNGPNFPDWDGGKTDEISIGEIDYWYPLNDSFRLRAFEHLGGIRLIADVGTLSSAQNVGDRHYRIGWDQTKLDYPEMARLKEDGWIQFLSFPADDLLDVDSNSGVVSTKMGVTVWALDFDVLPGATGTVDFTVEEVDLGFDLTGGWYPALNVPLP